MARLLHANVKERTSENTTHPAIIGIPGRRDWNHILEEPIVRHKLPYLLLDLVFDWAAEAEDAGHLGVLE